MKVKGLDGKTYGWDMQHANNVSRENSIGHENARILLKQLFPLDRLWEETALPGTKPMLYADFIIPFRKLLIEVHGRQHYVWVPHFHPTKQDFAAAKQRDIQKKRWCEINQFTYIELPDTETMDEWRNRILE
jgi:hypothetical protein